MTLFMNSSEHTTKMSMFDLLPILRKDSKDRELTEAKIVLISIMSVANVFMFLGNLLSIVTICSCHLRKKVSYWFVLNLAVIDILISVTVVPLNSVWEYYGIWPLGNTACEFFTFADISFSTISAYSIVLVSIDKYLYISYSIHYYHRMTRKLAIILIVTVWVSVFIFTTVSVLTEVGTREDFKDHFLALNNNTRSCIFVMTDSFVIPSAILCFFVPFFILCFTSSRIICIATYHIKKLHGSNSCGPESDSSDTSKIARHKDKNDNDTILTISKTMETGSLAKDMPNGCQLTGFYLTGVGPTILLSLEDGEDEFKTGHGRSESSNDSNSQSETLSFNGQPSDNMLEVREVKSRSCSFNNETTSTSTKSGLKQTDSFRSIAKKQSPYCKLFGTVTIVISCFVVMFAPYYITTMIDVACHCVPPWVYEDVLSVLYYLHSLVNPFIYMATDRKYKAALRSLLRKVKSKCLHKKV